MSRKSTLLEKCAYLIVVPAMFIGGYYEYSGLRKDSIRFVQERYLPTEQWNALAPDLESQEWSSRLDLSFDCAWSKESCFVVTSSINVMEGSRVATVESKWNVHINQHGTSEATVKAANTEARKLYRDKDEMPPIE